MKLATYKLKNSFRSYRVGAIQNEMVVDLNEAFHQMLLTNNEKDLVNIVDMLLPPSIEAFFSVGQKAIDRSLETISFVNENNIEEVAFPLSDVILGHPVPKGAKIICVGKNYKEHALEMNSDVPDYPVLFSKFSNAIIGCSDQIQKSPYTEKLDYEGELTIVIGKEASHVRKDDALQYVAGYTIGNDISARDLQKRTPQWLQGKSLDKSTPIGPWIVTSDELSDPSNLKIETFVNGEERQSSNTNKLIFNVPYLIEFISSLITLQPGDIILTGTPDGVGFGMNPPKFLQNNDVVRIEIEGIGVLENRVVDGEKPNY